ILACVQAADETLQEGDILIISSKYAAIAEERFVTLETIEPTSAAAQLAEQYNLSPQLAQLILQESDKIFGGIPGFVLSVKDNIFAPNAGIDESNIPEGQAVLYPAHPFEAAENIRQDIKARTGVQVGVALSDSRLMVGRLGTSGLAIGVAGFDPVQDERGKPDLLGRPLKVTEKATADNLCTAAELLMGEAAEGIPVVIARNTGLSMTDKRYSWQDTAIDYTLDLYLTILST
ncbi:MAG: coenzyme F420-0:L-glutamate ligase, partial [Anaerolineae bacterium]|nr:coenzyme F420-0:L-glutamate ligase [Anaerolineae bacterium]